MKTLPDLTTRELEMLKLVLAGCTNQGVTAEIYISERTVQFYLDKMNPSVGLRARILAAGWALGHAQASYLLD